MADFIGSLKRLLSEVSNNGIKLGNFYSINEFNAESAQFICIDFSIDDYGDSVLLMDENFAKQLGNEMLKIFQLTVENLNDELVLSTIGEAVNQSMNGAIQESAVQFGGLQPITVGPAQVLNGDSLSEKIADKSMIEIEGGMWLAVPNELAQILLEGHVQQNGNTRKSDDVAPPVPEQSDDSGDSSVEEVTFPTLKPEAPAQALPRNLDLLLDVKVTVSVELGRTHLNIKEILGLGSGSIITLDKLAGEPVDILVNGKPIAKGEVVVIDEAFGVRILDIIAPGERFKAE